jgi:hypothetical protein
VKHSQRLDQPSFNTLAAHLEPSPIHTLLELVLTPIVVIDTGLDGVTSSPLAGLEQADIQTLWNQAFPLVPFIWRDFTHLILITCHRVASCASQLSILLAKYLRLATYI